MIYGIGTDICDIRRIRASFERHGERFAEKILTANELATWRTRSQPMKRGPISNPITSAVTMDAPARKLR